MYITNVSVSFMNTAKHWSKAENRYQQLESVISKVITVSSGLQNKLAWEYFTNIKRGKNSKKYNPKEDSPLS